MPAFDLSMFLSWIWLQKTVNNFHTTTDFFAMKLTIHASENIIFQLRPQVWTLH